MSKQQLMLSAALAVLCAAVTPALADTEISSASTTALATTTAGNITITSSGGIQVSNGGAVVSLDSDNFVTNNGVLSNGNNNGSIGILIDTTDHNVIGQGSGLLSTNTISVTGTGNTKNGVAVVGGNTYFGNITLNAVTPIALLGAGSSITVSGYSIAAFNLSASSTVNGDIAFGGAITAQEGASPASTVTSPVLVQLSGKLYGNLFFDSTVAGSSVGIGARGISIVGGGIHACDATARAAVNLTCPTTAAGLGALINNGKFVAAGQILVNPASKDAPLEGGTVLGIGASIDGGVYNGGPYTANTSSPVGVFSGNGFNSAAVVLIDPNLGGTATQPIHIGPVSSLLDAIDPGYSFINRGSIAAAPAAAQLSTVAMFVQGAGPNVYTCLGNGDLNTCGNDGLGGLLNTGSLAAKATTNSTGVVLPSAQVIASALIVGPYAVIPRIDIKAEVATVGATTTGSINAEVSGTSGGISQAIVLAEGAHVPIINVGRGATVLSSVLTSTLVPSADVATLAAPFTLSATAIADSSSSLLTINNSGTIQAAVTTVTPGEGAVVATTVRAIDLLNSTANGITINNSGKILGDMLFGTGGNNFTLNVGNTGTNPLDNSVNSPNNYAVVAYTITNQVAGSTPDTIFSDVNFGAGTGHTLHVGAFGYVNSVIRSNPGALDVTVDTNGTLFIANTSATGSLNANHFDVNGGILGLTISQSTTATTPVIRATTEATIQANSTVAMQFGSFISSGSTTNLADYTTPITQHLVLISSPVINIDATTLAQNNAVLAQNLPFLFQPNATPLSIGTGAGNQTLELALTPRSPGATNPDGSPGLGLSGDALAQFPFIASALATDPTLGAAIARSMTVYNTPGQSASGINVAASQQQAQQSFVQFGPDTSGGARQVAILITDQATGPVAARQRLLRSYGKAPGDMTLWGTEFFGNINNKGRFDADGTLTNYKDHGFGFSLGMDGGSPRGGWYGGAFTFYSGDVTQTLPRATKTHTQWYMLTGYSSWKGNHLFLDTQMSAAYGSFKGLRDLIVGSTVREAEGKRASLLGALGVNMGAVFKAGGLDITPHFSLDGLSLREEGYKETGGSSGFNLEVAPYYANSLRSALGMDFSAGLNLFGVTVRPEARFGYRYDLVNSPVKLRAGFISTGGLGAAGNSMTFVGPDPDTGNMFGGLSVSVGTETWHLGVHYDYLRGNNGSVSQVGTISLLGRI